MPEPRYRQIAQDLSEKIESGGLGAGRQLPTEDALQREYAASRNTVREAVKWLVNRGLVETRPGSGTFVVERFDPVLATLDVETGYGGHDFVRFASEAGVRTREPTVSVPRVELQQASAAVARALQLAEDAIVVSRHQSRFIDGDPWSLQTTFYPMRYVQAGAVKLIEPVDMPMGAVRYLQEAIGIEQKGWQDLITVRPPNSDEAAFFKISDDGRVAVFVIRRLAYEATGRPLRLTVTAYRADRNQFLMVRGRAPGEADVPGQDGLTELSTSADRPLNRPGEDIGPPP